MSVLALKLTLWIFALSILSSGNGNACNDFVLSDALIVGTDTSGKSFLLCRVNLLGKEWIGISNTRTNQCTISYNASLHFFSHYKIISQNEFGYFIWSNTADNAIKIGLDASGNSLFVCRATINGHLIPGFTRTGHNYCDVIYQNKVVITNITNFLSRM